MNAPNMRIIIDLQACQSPGSRHRGIGRYSMALAKAMVKNATQHDVHLFLNGLFPESVLAMRAEFDGKIASDHVHVWNSPGPAAELYTENHRRVRAAELLREQALAELQPDIIHVSSLFEGLDDSVVTSIGRSGEYLPSVATLYDLIPLINADVYLQNPQVKAWYYRKIQSLKKANMLLSISEYSRQEALDWLQLPSERIVNISSAIDDRFYAQYDNNEQIDSCSKRYKINRPYIMYTGGIEPRKNIEALIRAFAALPIQLRRKYQLAIVCVIRDFDRARLEKLAQQAGLEKDELVLTGFVADEDLPLLYAGCALFVFPSWHEGFGLPALEAMACGAPVIASNTSSLPEVVGRPDALFNPYVESDITSKIHDALSVPGFAETLRKHGLQQSKKFSWDASAKKAIAGFEEFHRQSRSPAEIKIALSDSKKKPYLAFFVSPPMKQTGFTDNDYELLLELDRYYEIELISTDGEITNPWLTANFSIRTLAWFEQYAQRFERIIYNVGNSLFHLYMFDVMERYPGIVILQDFYLSRIASHSEYLKKEERGFAEALYASHGFSALREYTHVKDMQEMIEKYPCNFTVVDQALGVIVHSKEAIQLAHKWLGPTVAKAWHCIPRLRFLPRNLNRKMARNALGIAEGDFVICAFGSLDPSKLNHQLLGVWLSSPLMQDTRCHLIFVGENVDKSYGNQLTNIINESGLQNRVRITGSVDTTSLSNFLQATDLAVQLCALTTVENSESVLDCLAYGVATIVSGNQAMCELPEETVVKLSGDFNEPDLLTAILALWENAERRACLGRAARDYIKTQHAPTEIGEQFLMAIEDIIQNAPASKQSRLLNKIASIDAPSESSDTELCALAACISGNRQQLGQKRLFIDVTVLAQVDPRSGIQRVVRAILNELISLPPLGFRIEPVSVTPEGLRYVRTFTCKLFNLPPIVSEDELVEAQNGDIFLGLDLNCEAVVSCEQVFYGLRQKGVLVYFVIYDILPVLKPTYFRNEMESIFGNWLNTLMKIGDGALCISQAVADDLNNWIGIGQRNRLGKFNIGVFHLGADIEASLPTSGGGEITIELQSAFEKMPCFLMVGTLEPRKGHQQSIDAFEELWLAGVQICLIIVGGQGWKTEALARRLRSHPELGRRLFWLEHCSDETLSKLYQDSSALLMSSEGEGFGLPLIEAARHELPIIARDLPVFREIASDHAFYFQGMQGYDLSRSLQNWLQLFDEKCAPQAGKIKWLTWRESAIQLCQVLVDRE